jgi:23S rRNA U2552 (ribose-2'-O)-methylase RlmE/FtsJ|uniref:Ribosomal RNA methyltransferase FtsJ domain-containing protein n=1 Tax=viral metagenome TaxID=1070528 RepID=A0A6C0IPI0_9ZZZZ
MLYFLLHQIKYDILPKNLSIKIQPINNDEIDSFLSKSLSKYLNITKHNISKCASDWDTFKKYTNPFEFIHTNLPYTNNSISKYKPISRAFFKILEIYNTFNLIGYEYPINTFHLAEGPGGFIEATARLRNNKNDKYTGMTLLNTNDNNIPGWKKSEKFLRKYDNVILEYGLSKTGDLYNEQNFSYCIKHYKNSQEIITADGGFDFSIDFNNQERMAVKLIFVQVAYAIAMQKYKGSFILKMYDLFLKASADIIHLLSIFYNDVYITKPNTSRYANSEKYIVCTKFRFKDTSFITNKLHDIIKVLNNIDITHYKITNLLNIPLSLYLKNQLEEINSIFGQQQIENISNTFKLIYNNDKRKDKLENIKNQNISKCVNWCIQNKLDYNRTTNTSTNIFKS